MLTTAFFSVIGYAFVAVALSEGIRYYSTTTKTFNQLLQGIKYADLQAAKAQKKKKPMKQDPVYLKATGYQVRVQFFISLIFMMSFFMISSQYKEPITKLPFEPFSFLLWITQRGIQASHPSEVSATLIYLFALLVFRYYSKFIITIPKLPGPSIWEQAEKATNQLQTMTN